MGVPKFFRYISERYPCLSELAREEHIPCFDNMYLDMNGIVHNCTHPDDGNIHFKLTEEDMFSDICNYIDKLFFLIKPQKLFFMAIDGVAPRAKMNQQRSRRFRSAKESDVLASAAMARGEVIPEDRFDSNCITPGTPFMVRLHAALRHFIKYKISCDPFWQKCRVILSGHDCPGEGEHKIMDYIRYLKAQPNYDPYTRHCLYGLDADLIILGLCTHELHFAVLREQVQFGKKTKKQSVESTKFFLLHLGLMREYLELEFDELRRDNANFDVAQLIDDWVLMSFLVGNDFVPHLPCMHISTNALPLIYKTYMKVYPELGGNINEHGKLNLPRLAKFFEALSAVEFDMFQENWVELKYFETKKSANGIDEAFDVDVNDIKNGNQDEELQALIDSTEQFFTSSDDAEESMDEAQHINEEFEKYKHNYYMNKLQPDEANSENKREQALAYIEALQWILDYYYMGVRSWDWYYPYHYAPFISDLVNIETLKIEFNMGKPFLPFAQLLAVLPAASKKLLPAAYHELMTSPTSELAHFYPTDFKTDLNGKQHEWEAVVLIPFIDEKKLLNSMAACESKLEPHERERNTHGPMWQYDYCSESQGSLAAYYEFRMLSHVFCTETPVEAKEIALARDTSVCVELPNLMRHVFYPGFPTFKHLQFDFELKNMRVRVFDFPSRNENVMIKPVAREKHNDLDSMVVKYLDKIVYIGWPHLIKAKVVKISSATTTISNTDEITPTDPHVFQCQTRDAEEHLKTRMGIDVADYDVMLHVQTYEGTNHVVCNKTGKVIAEDIFRKQETVYPVQGVVSDITVHNAPSSLESEQKVDDFFAPNDMVFFIGSPYYGSQGVIIDPTLVYECGRLKVNITVPNEPNFETARHVQSNLLQGYMNLYATADMLGISARCLARITSPMFVVPDKRRDDFETSGKPYRISVELRNPKKVECEGYSRYANSQWFYSSQALELLQDYANRFPQVVEFMSSHDVDGKVQFAAEIFGDNFQQKLDEIIEWQEGQAYTKAERISCGGRVLAKEAILEIMQAVDQLKTLPVKTVKLQVKPHLLLKPDYALPSVYKSKCSIRLFDRVVIVKTTYMVPIGSKGTIIGIYPIQDPNPVRLECVGTVQHVYDVLFDKKLTNGHDIHGIAEGQVYRVPESSLLLIYQQENGYQDRDKYGQGEPQANTNNTFKVQTRQSGANTNANKNGNWKNNNAETSKPVITNWRIAAPAKPTAEEPQEDKGSSRWGFKRPPRNANSTSQEQDAATAISSASATATADAHKQKNNVDFWTPNEYAAPVNNNSNNNNNNNNNNYNSNSNYMRNNNQNNHNNNNSRGTSNEQVVKPQRNMASASMDLMPEFVKRNPAVVAQSIRECDEKTATLRNLLGIQTTETPCQPMPPTLPYPPQLWRNEARQYSQQQKQQQRQQNQINQERDNNSAGRSWRSGQTTAAPPVANFANFSQMEKLTLGSPTMAPSGVTTTTTAPIQVKKSPKTPKIAAKFDMP